jgi:hypothetical protein
VWGDFIWAPIWPAMNGCFDECSLEPPGRSWPISDRYASPNRPFSETNPAQSSSGKSRPQAARCERQVCGRQDTAVGLVKNGRSWTKPRWINLDARVQ